jgi:hypothetical protein
MTASAVTVRPREVGAPVALAVRDLAMQPEPSV